MDRESRFFEILEKLGFNTTRLRWKLYQWQKRRDNKQNRSWLPTSLHWLTYPNKHCLRCGKLVDGDAKVCPQCDRRVPSLAMYRVQRLLGMAQPGSASQSTIVVFLVVMVALYLLEIVMEGGSAVWFPSPLTTRIFGGWTASLAIGYQEYWRYLSFGLAHFGILHIGFNSYALMQVGPLVENEIGKSRMLVVITVTQLTAAFGSQFWYFNLGRNPMMLTVGASGWLFGLIGYGIALFWVSHGMARVYRNVLAQWAIYALVFGFFLGFNNAAHLGGLIGGLVLGFLPLGDTRRTQAFGYVWNAAAILSVVLWCITLVFLAKSIITGWAPGGVPQ